MRAAARYEKYLCQSESSSTPWLVAIRDRLAYLASTLEFSAVLKPILTAFLRLEPALATSTSLAVSANRSGICGD
eukprot:3719663-Pleurochrysis_carterae.AAC.2